MTEEELEKSVDEYFEIMKEKKIPFTISNTNKCIKQAYIDGYKQGQKDTEVFGATYFIQKNEQLEKENEELEARIEKMKCCGNCNDYLASVCKCRKINEYRICDSVCNDWS